MSRMYVSGMKAIGDGGIAWASADVRVLLVTSAYTFDETHDFVSDLSGELTNTGYGRKNVAGRSSILDDANHRTKFDAGDTLFASLGAGSTPSFAIVYLYNASDSAAQLIACCELTAPPAPNGGDYTIQWGADGVFVAAN